MRPSLRNPDPRLLRMSSIAFHVFRLAYVAGCAHAAQHVVGEEKLAVGWDHHDLEFVGETLGDDFVDQQRILLQDRGLARHALGVGSGGQADALGFGLRQQLAAFSLGLAVDELGFADAKLAKAAGAEFVKTSTGFSTAGAAAHDIALMRQSVGPEMGIKASGGIRSLQDLQAMTAAGATRIGASASVKIVEATAA